MKLKEGKRMWRGAEGVKEERRKDFGKIVWTVSLMKSQGAFSLSGKSLQLWDI